MIEQYITFKYYEEVGGLIALGVMLILTVVFLIIVQVKDWWKR